MPKSPIPMNPVEARNRLQPALFDRLIDDQPGARAEADDRRTMSKARLRAAVLRDLGALFNATRPLDASAAADPLLAASVVGFGLPALSGQIASKLDIGGLEAAIRDAVVRFEPRILAESLEVRALQTVNTLDAHNVVELEIRGHLWSQPVPLEILLRTQVDLEGGRVTVLDPS